jgi:hypothetical protein
MVGRAGAWRVRAWSITFSVKYPATTAQIAAVGNIAALKICSEPAAPIVICSRAVGIVGACPADCSVRPIAVAKTGPKQQSFRKGGRHPGSSGPDHRLRRKL